MRCGNRMEARSPHPAPRFAAGGRGWEAVTTPAPRHRRQTTSRSQAPAADLVRAARTMQPRTVALRRALHRHPEQGLHLPTTQSAVLAALADLPVRVHTGATTSSVVGVIEGGRPGPTI